MGCGGGGAMSSEQSPIESFFSQILANTVGDKLRHHYGQHQFYALQEVQAVCHHYSVPKASWESAIAMFAKREECEEWLSKLGSTRTALEIRRELAAHIFLHAAP